MENVIVLFEVTIKDGKMDNYLNMAAHRMCQKHGRMNDFADYKITVVTPVRTCTMTECQDAPADSNHFFEV